jgi:tRNA threonylcarbamoyladenosine biosynthesis protein TsaB
MSPTILTLDSSTEACSCALSVAGVISEQFEFLPRLHTKHILPMIKKLVSDHDMQFSDLDAVAVGAGPGSFTGLRIAAGVAQGIAFGADLPLIPVSTLASMAQQHLKSDKDYVLSCLDARINEVYWALYAIEDGRIALQGEETLCKPELLKLALNKPCYAVGNGMTFIEQMPDQTQALITGHETEVYPRAAAMTELALQYFEQGRLMQPEDFSPTYLRNKVTQN